MKADGSPGRGRAGVRGIFAAIVVLYALSIPWYRDPAQDVRIWLGLPDWVAVAVGCYVGVAVLNALAWLLTDFHDEAPSGDEERP